MAGRSSLVGSRITMTEKHSLFDLKRHCSSTNGVPERDVVLRYKGREIQDGEDLFREGGLRTGDHYLVPLTWTQDKHKPEGYRFAITNAEGIDTNKDKYIDKVRIQSNPKYEELILERIKFYSNFHMPDKCDKTSYAGFILYGWRDHSDGDKVKSSWKIGECDVDCDTGLMTLQNTTYPFITKYTENKQYPPQGGVHGGVYWAFFGGSIGKEPKELWEDSHGVNGDKIYDPRQAIGEGFSYNSDGSCTFKQRSGTFNANIDGWHDGDRAEMADVTRECTYRVIQDWRDRGYDLWNSPKEYPLKDLKIKVK